MCKKLIKTGLDLQGGLYFIIVIKYYKSRDLRIVGYSKIRFLLINDYLFLSVDVYYTND